MALKVRTDEIVGIRRQMRAGMRNGESRRHRGANSMSEPTYEFRVSARRDPQSLQRVLDYFSQRGLVPASLVARTNGNEISATVVVPGLSPEAALLIAEKIRASFLVRKVQLALLPVV